MSAKKILFITQEIIPYVPESTLSIWGQELPQAIHEKGYEIRTFSPKWGNINERRNQLHEVIRLSGMNLIIDETDHPLIIKVASLQSSRRQVYFIDNDDYFQHRLMTTNEEGEEYDDNGERAIFYARGVLETVKKLRWTPDIIHCQGWMSAIAPIYIKKFYKDDPSFKHTKVVFSAFEDGFNTPLQEGLTQLLLLKGITAKHTNMLKEPATHEELCKLAVAYSDAVVLNSPNVHNGIVEYAQSLDLPMIHHSEGEAFADACDALYKRLLGESE